MKYGFLLFSVLGFIGLVINNDWHFYFLVYFIGFGFYLILDKLEKL